MRTTFDPEADAFYLYLSEDLYQRRASVKESEEVLPGIVLDFGEGGRLIGLEVLDARTRIFGEVLDAASLPGKRGEQRKE